MRNELIAAAILFCASCAQPTVPTTGENPPPAGTSPSTSMTGASGPAVTFPDGFPVRVEVVADDESRQRGMMWRDRLPEDRGMLFIFPRNEEHAFWMKNTLIPLDMIWIGENGQVLHVKHDVPPCQADPCPSYPPGVPSRYVLEVAAGVARKHGVEAGSTVTMSGLENIVVR